MFIIGVDTWETVSEVFERGLWGAAGEGFSNGFLCLEEVLVKEDVEPPSRRESDVSKPGLDGDEFRPELSRIKEEDRSCEFF